jgi:hypothetical protein
MPYKCPKRQHAYQLSWRKKNPGYHSRYWRTVMKPLVKGGK